MQIGVDCPRRKEGILVANGAQARSPMVSWTRIGVWVATGGMNRVARYLGTWSPILTIPFLKRTFFDVRVVQR